jgi:uncharacterized membrane protein YgcG
VLPVAADCPVCRLSFARAKQLLGPLPQLHRLLADLAGLLSPQARKRILRKIELIHRRFPQLTLQVVLNRFPDAHPFSLHVFWLFNIAALGGESRRGRNCHGLLLAIDPHRGEAALMPGYGLEPYLPENALDELLALAEPHWQTARWADGILRVLDGLDRLLSSMAIAADTRPTSAADF